MKSMLVAIALGLPAFSAEPLAVELISEVKVIAPGETFNVGLHLKPEAGYHTYWKHPGIVGVATTIEWDLPPGFKAGEIQWPAPETVDMAGHAAQGYRGETLLIVPITAPAELTGTGVNLTARASWMCCGKECNPGSDLPFPITLPVGKSSEANPENAPLFERFRALLPQADPAWSAEFTRGEKSIVLTLTSTDPAVTRDVSELGEPRFFTADGQVDSEGKQQVTRGPGQVLQIVLPLSEHEKSAGPPSGTIVAAKSWRKAGGPVALGL